MSSTAEDFGDASCDKVNCNIKIFWAFNLNFTVLRTLLIFKATHLCTVSLRATHPEFVRTWGNWSTQAAKLILPPQGWFSHHSFIALPILVFHVVPNQFVFIQEEESAMSDCVFSHLVVLISWFVPLQFSIVTQETVAKSAVLLLLEIFLVSSTLCFCISADFFRSLLWSDGYAMKKCHERKLSNRKCFQYLFYAFRTDSKLISD